MNKLEFYNLFSVAKYDQDIKKIFSDHEKHKDRLAGFYAGYKCRHLVGSSEELEDDYQYHLDYLAEMLGIKFDNEKALKSAKRYYKG